MRRLQKVSSFNWRKWFHLTMIACSGFVLMLYQNCAPPRGTEFEQAGDVPPPSVIDDVNLSTGVSFVQKNIELQSSNLAFNIHGICAQEQNGARLSWNLIDGLSNATIFQGQADCVRGGFQVTVDDVQDLECGATHILQAQLGMGESGEVSVVRRCNPESSKPILDAQLASKGIVCFFESSPGLESCEKSCYHNEILQDTMGVDKSLCGI